MQEPDAASAASGSFRYSIILHILEKIIYKKILLWIYCRRLLKAEQHLCPQGIIFRDEVKRSPKECLSEKQL